MAKQYLKAREAGDKISVNDESLQRLETRAREYFNSEEGSKVKTMNEEQKLELIRTKAEQFLDIDEERF